MTKITSFLVSPSKRAGFMPEMFGRSHMIAENLIYTTMEKFFRTYDGGFWNFYKLSNGGFYMAPETDTAMPIFIATNDFDGELSADAAGIVVTLYVLNYFCCKTENEELIDKYYHLRNFALEHKEARLIFAAID